MITIYHNPRCSKSRQALQLLEKAGVETEVVRYLENPPDADTLRDLLRKLNMRPRELMRKGEEIYKVLNLADMTLSDDDLIAAMVEHPKLIERPIVVRDDQAVLGRPPENVGKLVGTAT